VKQQISVLALAALGLASCRSDEPTATGRIQRPAGLAVLVRPDQDMVPREDLLIVDSEAEGVKVLQYLGTNPSTRDFGFVPAPNVFFPLVIPSPGFPTEIAVSPGAVERLDANVLPGDLAYVLSSGSSQLHLIDVAPLGYGGSVVSQAGNSLIRTIELDEPGLIPTDVAVFPSGDSDLVVIAFEGIGAPDTLMIMRSDEATDSVVGTATIAPQPRGIAIRETGTGMFVLASSGDRAISEVQIDPNTGAVLGARTVDVGGPTSDVIDAGEHGAFAIRSDRPRVVHLVPGPAGLMRSTVIDDSPFTPDEERRSLDSGGFLDVYPSPIGAASLGTFDSFTDIAPRSTVLRFTGSNDLRIVGERTFRRSDSEDLPVLLLAHADGNASFVVLESETASIATSLDATVYRVSTSSRMSVEVIDPEAGNTVLGACNTVSCSESAPEGEVCPPSIIRYERPYYGKYRATFRGTLVSSQTAELTKVDGAEATYRITDQVISSFEGRFVLVNDRVLTHVQSQNCDDLSAPMDLIATGTVTKVEGGAIEVAYEAGFAPVQSCEGMESLPALATRIEIYPGSDEMVLARFSGETVVQVLSRAPVVTSSAGASVVFRDDPEEHPLDLAIKTSSTAPFTCSEGAALCSTDSDCGVARECTTGTGSCPRTCAAACSESEPTCFDRLVGRHCAYAEFEVAPTVPFSTSTADAVGNITFPSAAPASAVFSPERGTWVISFPGSRVLVELTFVSDNPNTPEVVGDADQAISHIR
jgi:hypothetical protein